MGGLVGAVVDLWVFCLRLQLLILKKLFELLKKMWKCDKGITIFLLLAIFAGFKLKISFPPYWFGVVILGAVFGIFAHDGETLNIAEDYQGWLSKLILGTKELSNRKVIVNGKNYEAPPRPDLDLIIPQVVQSLPTTYKTIDIQQRSEHTERKMGAAEREIFKLDEALKEGIKFQDLAIDKVIKGLKRKAAGTDTNKQSPLTFLMTGPTGTGKTELVKIVAKTLKRQFERYDMGNFKDRDQLWQLLGSPQGYYGGDGKLTRFVKDKPTAILLFDEIEKGHDSLFDFMLPMIDEGFVKDRRTNESIDFSKTIIFFTSNLVTNVPDEARKDPEVIRDLITQKNFLRPEFVGRIKNLVPFFNFQEEEMRILVEIKVKSYFDKVFKDKGKPIVECSVNMIDFLLEKADVKYGVRNIDTQIDNYIGNALTEILFRNGNKTVRSVKADVRNKEIILGVE